MGFYSSKNRDSYAGSYVASTFTAGAASAVCVAANTNRAGTVTITNTGANPAYLSLGGTAVTGTGIPLVGSGFGSAFQVPASEWRGAISIISALGTTVAINEGSR